MARTTTTTETDHPLESKDLYERLGLSADAGVSPKQIDKAYKKLAKRYHPDKKGGDNASFQKLNHAYTWLKDPKKRAFYDQYGFDELSNYREKPPPSTEDEASKPPSEPRQDESSNAGRLGKEKAKQTKQDKKTNYKHPKVRDADKDGESTENESEDDISKSNLGKTKLPAPQQNLTKEEDENLGVEVDMLADMDVKDMFEKLSGDDVVDMYRSYLCQVMRVNNEQNRGKAYQNLQHAAFSYQNVVNLQAVHDEIWQWARGGYAGSPPTSYFDKNGHRRARQGMPAPQNTAKPEFDTEYVLPDDMTWWKQKYHDADAALKKLLDDPLLWLQEGGSARRKIQEVNQSIEAKTNKCKPPVSFALTVPIQDLLAGVIYFSREMGKTNSNTATNVLSNVEMKLKRAQQPMAWLKIMRESGQEKAKQTVRGFKHWPEDTYDKIMSGKACYTAAEVKAIKANLAKINNQTDTSMDDIEAPAGTDNESMPDVATDPTDTEQEGPATSTAEQETNHAPVQDPDESQQGTGDESGPANEEHDENMFEPGTKKGFSKPKLMSKRVLYEGKHRKIGAVRKIFPNGNAYHMLVQVNSMQADAPIWDIVPSSFFEPTAVDRFLQAKGRDISGSRGTIEDLKDCTWKDFEFGGVATLKQWKNKEYKCRPMQLIQGCCLGGPTKFWARTVLGKKFRQHVVDEYIQAFILRNGGDLPFSYPSRGRQRLHWEDGEGETLGSYDTESDDDDYVEARRAKNKSHKRETKAQKGRRYHETDSETDDDEGHSESDIDDDSEIRDESRAGNTSQDGDEGFDSDTSGSDESEDVPEEKSVPKQRRQRKRGKKTVRSKGRK